MKPSSIGSTLGARGDAPAAPIARYLREARMQLGMDVAYVAEIRDGHRIFRFVDGDALPDDVRVGTADPLGETFASRVADGGLSEAADVAARPDLAELPEARACRIGSFVGVPIRLGTGELYGVLACFARAPVPGLDDRAVSFLHVFARQVLDQLETEHGEQDDLRRHIDRIERTLEPGSLEIIFQPVFDIRSGQAVGAEALARFPIEPQRPPDAWFEEAWTVGRGVDLELAAAELALSHLGRLPHGAFLSINVAAETAASPRMLGLLAGVPRDRVVLEVPERAPVEDHYALTQAVEDLRALGVRLAVDDAGAGIESLGHILELRPELIKFDVALTRDVDTDPVRHRLATSLVEFARQFDALVVAEGIETQAELETLREIGFGFGQGYHLGRPGPLPLAERTLAPA